MTLRERLRRLDDRVLPRRKAPSTAMLGFLTVLYGLLTALRLTLIVVDEDSRGLLSNVLLTAFAALTTSMAIRWRRAVANRGLI